MADSSEQLEATGTLTPAEAGQLSEQIASLASSGRPLGPGLAALASELPRGRLRQSLFHLSRALEQGKPLDKAMEEQSERIPPHLRGLVLGALRSNRLGDVLGRFSAYMSIGTELKRKLWLSLAYPIMSCLVAVTLFVLVNVMLVRQFEVIFKDFGVQLPAITIGMLLISHWLQSGWSALPAVLGLIVALWLLSRIFLRAPDRRSLAAQIPVVGKVWKYTSWAEYCHLLALLLESHLTLPEALRLAGAGVQNSDLDQASQIMANEVEQGASLAQAMASRYQLPSSLRACSAAPGSSTPPPRSCTWRATCTRPAPAPRPPSRER